MRGRKAKPVATKRLTGSRNIHGDEVEGPKGIPKCPRHLRGRQRRIWAATVDLLSQMQLMTLADAGIVSRYSVIFDRWLTAEDEIAKTGTVTTTHNGFHQKSAYLTVADKCIDQLDKADSKLGLSPSDRARLHAKFQEIDNDGFDEFLKSKGRN